METENGELRTGTGGRRTDDRRRPGQTAVTRRETICQALAEAHRRCLASDEKRDTSHAGLAGPPCCGDCAYAVPLLDGARRLLACTHCPRRPRQMRVTDSSHRCPFFRRKRRQSGKTVLPEPPDGSIRYIPLTQGKYAVVDAADYERAALFSWHASVSGTRTYACTRINGRNVSLHRFLTNAPKGMVVDHIDHDGLNDRQSNLRVCTQEQNLYNSRPKGKSSRFKGVSWNKHERRWVVHICYHGRNRYIGQFTDEIEAARAYDRMAYQLFGEYAYLNFPEEISGRSG